MTWRRLLGLPKGGDARAALEILRRARADLDDDVPRVRGQHGFDWFFIDVVDRPDIHLVQVALGCDSRTDGALKRWGSTVHPDQVRSLAAWWGDLLWALASKYQRVAIVRHWYAGLFTGEIVELVNAHQAS